MKFYTLKCLSRKFNSLKYLKKFLIAYIKINDLYKWRIYVFILFLNNLPQNNSNGYLFYRYLLLFSEDIKIHDDNHYNNNNC